jgi:D-serine deaminase-like pyridoxal phosphate-dependent protein
VTLDRLDTPALTVDLTAVERNIERMQSYCNRHGIALWPHIKTHKLPAIAHMQMRAGAAGITCQKLGEAEVMAAAGLGKILITFPIVGQRKLRRLARLAAEHDVAVVADSEAVVRGLSRALAEAGASVGFLVECDTGQGRAGVQTPEAAAALGALAASLPGLEFAGLMTHPLPDGYGPFFARARELLAEHGLDVERASVGGTPTGFTAHAGGGVTELRAGTYVFGDRSCMANGTVTLEDCALRVRATVVSIPTPARVVIDAGSKSLTTDPGAVPEGGFGYVVGWPGATIYELHEEHALVDISGCETRAVIGDTVEVIPNHVCPTVNLHDEVFVHRGGEVVARWPVAARGKVR